MSHSGISQKLFFVFLIQLKHILLKMCHCKTESQNILFREMLKDNVLTLKEKQSRIKRSGHAFRSKFRGPSTFQLTNSQLVCVILRCVFQ